MDVLEMVMLTMLLCLFGAPREEGPFVRLIDIILFTVIAGIIACVASIATLVITGLGIIFLYAIGTVVEDRISQGMFISTPNRWKSLFFDAVSFFGIPEIYFYYAAMCIGLVLQYTVSMRLL